MPNTKTDGITRCLIVIISIYNKWWLAINPYDYSDGLVYINGTDGAYKKHDNARLDGQVVNSKQLWVFGNYARFVRPDMKRVRSVSVPPATP